MTSEDAEQLKKIFEVELLPLMLKTKELESKEGNIPCWVVVKFVLEHLSNVEFFGSISLEFAGGIVKKAVENRNWKLALDYANLMFYWNEEKENVKG